MLDKAQQFHPFAIAVSNREDSVMYEAMINGVRKLLLEEDNMMRISCTISDNADAIINAFQKSFPEARIGNCYFILPKISKKLREISM